MLNFRQRLLRFFLIILVLSTISLALQACGDEDSDEDKATQADNSNNQASEDLAVGDMAPAFTLPSADGQDVSLSDYVGQQPVLLYFHMAVG